MKLYFLPFLIAAVAEAFNVSPDVSFRRTGSVAMNESNGTGELSRRTIVQSIMLTSVLPAVVSPQMASARLEAVNRPDLLPSEAGLNVIQTEKFLTPGQAKRLDKMMANLEKDTGFRLKLLCQNYPNTPGKLRFEENGHDILFVAKFALSNPYLSQCALNSLFSHNHYVELI